MRAYTINHPMAPQAVSSATTRADHVQAACR